MESLKIGFIGLGMMGKPMATRLLETGFPLRVYNRTREKAEDLLVKGAMWCNSPRVLMGESNIVISMVSDPQALEVITFGPDGTLKGSVANKIHIDMSTVSPQITAKLERAYRVRQASFLHAPVLGSVPQAAEGSLLIFVGGDANPANRCQPIFNTLGRRIWYFGEVAKATHMKLICNLFIGSMITTLSEGFTLGQKTGLSTDTLLEALKESALNAPMYQTKGVSIRDRNFSPRFLLTHMLKDLNLIVESANQLGLSFPVIGAIRELFATAQFQGLGGEDYSAVVKVLERSP